MWFEWALFAVACAAGASIIWSTLRLGISPMPSSRAVRRVVLEAVPPGLEGEVHELGAGWGTLAFALAARCPRARVIAWEASPVPFAVCWLRARLTPRANLELRFADFFTADLRGARLVVAYLWTGGMERLAQKLDRELGAGAEVLSHTFALRGRAPLETRHAGDLYRTPVYRYGGFGGRARAPTHD
ncbi:MAG: SAM-dependent methyltransferase [Myxococcota bacterium]